MSRDEFDHYDLSEFTEEQLLQFDERATNNLLQKPDDGPEILPISQQDIRRKASLTSLGGGGPALDIAFESLTDAFLEEIPKPAVSARNYLLPASTSLPLQRTSTYVSRKRPPKKGKNPYEQFCSWKKGFSVTDLVSPVWCEVQYEYGLYGERYKPLERRPSTFISRNGKEIQVQQNVAQHNDITLKRGASIHKALEREVRPETVPVRITTDEERWALRLSNLTTGLEQLILDGRTRELPVFGITHGQVVFGIIDEVTRCVPSEEHKCHNSIKRSYVSSEVSPVKKKQRRSPSPSKHHIPIVCLDKSIPEEACVLEQLSSEEEVHDTPVTENSTRRPIHPQPTFYDLTLIDYKTRRAPSLPPEEDTVSSQLQLMLYHRLLSTLLLPETFDFNALWAKQGINPHRSFSRSFVEDIGWPTEGLLELHVDLCSMVAAWVSAVHSARSCGEPLRGISPELQIIYRKASVEKNPFPSQQKKPGSEHKAAENHLEALALQEELDVARAIEESLFSLNQESGDSTITQVVLDNITPAPHSEEPALDEAVDLSNPPLDDSELKLTAQGSLPACTSNIPGFKAQLKEREGTRVPDEPANLEGSEDRILPSRKDETPDEDASGLSMILGTRKFFMDDSRLDAHLKDVLEWWFGIRPPKGVEVAQSGRCFTCEYRDGCEWREQKSQQARIAPEKRRESN